MKQLIEEQRKDFDIWFKEYPGVPTIGEIQEWYEDRFKQFIDELIASENGRLSNQKRDNGHDCYEHNCEYCENAIKDGVIEETIAHLKKLKEELN